MAMGRQKDGQGDLMVSWSEMPRSPGHVFYDRLQSVLIEGGFDAFAEASCRPYYAARMGAPSVPPGRYFRMHLVGYFEGIDSERGLEWRCSDSLSLRAFLRLGSRDRVPDHSWLSRSRTRLPHEVHAAVFDWVLVLIAEAGLIKGERIGVDASTMEANAALRNIVRRDNGEGYREMLERLARESGVETPTAESLARLDRKRKGKNLSNTDWVSKSDPEAKIAKMKDGTTHLAYKPEHAVDLDTGAVVAAELHPADEGDTTTLSKTLAKAEANLEAVDAAPTPEDPAECVADKGYHSRAVLRALNDSPWKTRIAAPKQTGFSRWHGDEAARRAVTKQPCAAQVRGRPRGLQAARRDRRALLCPQPRSWRHATNLAARARECAQAVPAPRRRPQSIVTDAPAHRCRHPAGGRGGRIWRYFRSAHAHRGHAGGTGGLAKRPDGFRRRIPHLGVRAGKSHLINGLLGTLPAIHWTPTAMAATVAGTLIYIGAVVIWSGGWATLLAAVGEPVGVFRSFIIIGVSQPAKYLPGNVAHHIGRAAFATQFGLGSLGVVLPIALEVFSLIAAAVVCALLAVALTNSTTATNLAPLATSTLAALVVGAIAVPIGGLLAARRWRKRMLRPPPG